MGQQISDAFEEINGSFDQLDWYFFPIEQQKALPMILINVQAPVVFKCFGEMLCGSRDTFKMVCITRSSMCGVYVYIFD